MNEISFYKLHQLISNEFIEINKRVSDTLTEEKHVALTGLSKQSGKSLVISKEI